GGLDHLPVRREEQDLEPYMYTRLVASGGQRLYRHLGAGKAHLPPSRLVGDGDRLDRAFHGMRPAHRKPPDLGEDQLPVVAAGAVVVLRRRCRSASGSVLGRVESPASRRSPRGGRTRERCCPGAPAAPARRDEDWPRTPGSSHAPPSMLPLAASA